MEINTYFDYTTQRLAIYCMPDPKIPDSTSLKQAYKRMQGLQHVTSELSKAVTKKDVARIIINEGFAVLQAESGDIVLQKDNSLEVIAYKGYNKKLLEALDSKENVPPLLTRVVMTSKQPYFITDRQNLPRRFEFAKKFLEKVHAQSAALLPLLEEDNVIGVVQFTFKNQQFFFDEDKEFMMTLAQQCAQAFQRVTFQEELTESKKELEIILSSVADGILVQDDKGKVIYVNQALGRIFSDVPHEELRKLSWEGFLNLFEISDENSNILPHAYMPGRRALTTGENVKVTFKFTHKMSQRSRWLHIESTVIHLPQRKRKNVVSVFQDITVMKELEQRKDDFISMASHELKTPLTSAKVFSHVLRKQLKNKDDGKLLQKIDRQLDLLTDLTKDLLDITKLQKGKFDLTKKRFDIEKVVREVIEDLQPSTHHKIRIISLDRTQLYADKDKIAQVITNFLTNAIKYSSDKTEILVKVRRLKSSIQVSVQDAGIGIDTADIGQIFERFYRIEKDKKTYPGLGLGLYISSEIVKQHEGKIWVESKKGKGSTFYFALPLKPFRS